MRNKISDKDLFDVEFDLRNDQKCKGLKPEPDSCSEILYSWHRNLWNKKLPNGEKFDIKLSENYLELLTMNEKFRFGSDWMINTYYDWKRQKDVIDEIPFSEINDFNRISNTIGNFIIFPRPYKTVENTINKARGCRREINDRFDLTLECIRLYYNHEKNPLYDVLKDYQWFFDLFISPDNKNGGISAFKEYCNFFLLQDLVDENYTKINFFLEFKNFNDDNLPKNVDEYLEYKKNCINFIKKRNKRMLDFIKKNEFKEGLSILDQNLEKEYYFHGNLNSDYIFDNFVTGKNNSFVIDTALKVTNDLGKSYNPFLIYGKSGLGKTHLIHAMAHSLLNNKQLKIICINAKDFPTELIEAMKEHKREMFHRRYSSCDVLLIDDIQFFENKEETQNELIHIFDKRYDNKKQIVLSCDKHPSKLKGIVPRFQSRLQEGLNVKIEDLDFETAKDILINESKKRGVIISDEIINLLIERFLSDIRILKSTFLKLAAYKEINNKAELNIEAVEKLLADMH